METAYHSIMITVKMLVQSESEYLGEFFLLKHLTAVGIFKSVARQNRISLANS